MNVTPSVARPCTPNRVDTDTIVGRYDGPLSAIRANVPNVVLSQFGVRVCASPRVTPLPAPALNGFGTVPSVRASTQVRRIAAQSDIAAMKNKFISCGPVVGDLKKDTMGQLDAAFILDSTVTLVVEGPHPQPASAVGVELDAGHEIEGIDASLALVPAETAARQGYASKQRVDTYVALGSAVTNAPPLFDGSPTSFRSYVKHQEPAKSPSCQIKLSESCFDHGRNYHGPGSKGQALMAGGWS